MNILFLTELFPIRDEFWHFESVIHGKWLPIVEMLERHTECFASILCNHRTLERVANKRPSCRRYLSCLTRDEESFIDNFFQPWSGAAGKSRWISYLSGDDDEFFDFYIRLLTRLTKQNPNLRGIVVWGQNDVLKKVCQKMELGFAAMELSSMRPPFPESVYIDPIGANGTSINCALTQEKFLECCGDLQSRPEIESVIERNSRASIFSAEYENSFLNVNARPPGEYILCPLQLADDANMLMYSPYDSVATFLEDVYNLVSGSNINLLVKPHPGALVRGGENLGAYFRIQQKVKSMPNVFWLDQEYSYSDYIRLLTEASAVVTINSSVGFEARILGTPSYCFGRSIYTFSSVSQIPEFASFVKNGLSRGQPPSYSMVSALMKVTFLRYNCLVDRPYSFLRRLEIAFSCTDERDASSYVRSISSECGYDTWSAHHA